MGVVTTVEVVLSEAIFSEDMSGGKTLITIMIIVSCGAIEFVVRN
jgi:hypothetical protein